LPSQRIGMPARANARSAKSLSHDGHYFNLFFMPLT
jgi:hypothetical protein